MPHPNDPLHDDVPSILARSRAGGLKWVNLLDCEGEATPYYEAVDLEEELSYSVTDGSMDEDEDDPENRCGPSIMSYCYDVETKEWEPGHDGMVLHKYASPEVQRDLDDLVTFVKANHTTRNMGEPLA